MKTVLLALVLTQGGVSPQTTAAVSGRVLSSDGRPASNVQIALTTASGAGSVLLTHTDSSGRYRIEGVAAGQYLIVARPANRPTYLPGVAARTAATVLTIVAGPAVEVPEFRLMSNTGTPALRVQGRIDGIPAGESPAVGLDRLGGDPGDRFTPVTITPDGSFEVAELPPGTYEVYVGGRVRMTFVLTDKDVAGLSLSFRR